METAKQKTITFEFSTVDFVPEDISNEFVKEDLLPQQHREILIEQLNDIVRQLNEDPTKIPQVHFAPEQQSQQASSSPSREKKPAVNSMDMGAGPSSPAKTAPDVVTSPQGTEGGSNVQVRKSRFTILPISSQVQVETSPAVNSGGCNTPNNTMMTPDSTIHQLKGQAVADK